MPDQSKYSSCKATEIRSNDKGNFGCRHLYDGQVINNAQEGNFFTKSLKNPWAEVELTEAVYIVAIEVTTYGVADDERFIFTNFLAGMTSTAKTDGSKPANDITDVPLMTHWRGPATQGQILHITFPTPVMAKYVLLQGRNLNHPWNIAELKVIEGKQVALTPRLMCHYSSFPSATFDECPKRDRVVVTSNQVQHTDYSGQNWEDCAVRCEATPGCDCWNWNPAYMICRSDTGCCVRMHRYRVS